VIDASGVEVDESEYDCRTLYDATKGTTPKTINGVYHWYDYTYCHGDFYKYDIEVTAADSSIHYEGVTTQAAFRIGAKSMAKMGSADPKEPPVKYDTVTWGGKDWDYDDALADTSGNYIKITYTGQPIKPTVKHITYLDRPLRLAADDWYMRPYDYDYIYIYGNPNPEESNQTSTDPVNATSPDKPACMTVRHLTSSSFRNYVNVFFTIVPANMAVVEATPIGDQAYTGRAVTPSVKLSYNGMNMVEGTDYTLSYRNNTAAGKAEIIASGKGNYSGVKVLPFTITGGKKPVTLIQISKATAAPIKTQVYSGKALTPAVNPSYGGAALKAGADYALSYRNNIAPGKAEVTVTGKGRFTGVKTLYFTINPAKAKITKLTPGKRKLTVKFTKPAAAQKATKIQLRYRQKGAKKWKTVNVSVKKTSYVIKTLKKGKRYQIQMRIVRTIKTGNAKGGYNGAWSAVKTSKAIK
jgi:hypothetical protein